MYYFIAFLRIAKDEGSFAITAIFFLNKRQKTAANYVPELEELIIKSIIRKGTVKCLHV